MQYLVTRHNPIVRLFWYYYYYYYYYYRGAPDPEFSTYWHSLHLQILWQLPVLHGGNLTGVDDTQVYAGLNLLYYYTFLFHFFKRYLDLYLRSASSTDLVVPATRRSTICDREFAVAGPRAWNSLPPAVRSSATYNIFQKDLKSHIFGLSFSLWQLCILTMYSALVVVYTAYCAL